MSISVMFSLKLVSNFTNKEVHFLLGLQTKLVKIQPIS